MSRELRAYVRLILQESIRDLIIEVGSDDATMLSPVARGDGKTLPSPGGTKVSSATKVSPTQSRKTPQKASQEKTPEDIKKELHNAGLNVPPPPYDRYKNIFDRLEAAAIGSGLMQLGIGSSRVAYDVGNNKVLKIARNRAGINQNGVEYTMSYDLKPGGVGDIIATVDKDLSDVKEFYWIVSEKVRQVDAQEAAELAGVKDWDTVVKIIKSLLGGRLDVVSSVMNSEDLFTDVSTGKKFFKNLEMMLDRYEDQLAGDLTKIDSWGESIDGKLKLLDYGITNETFAEKYKRGFVDPKFNILNISDVSRRHADSPSFWCRHFS